MAVTPTKGNLISLKRSLALAKTGYDLIDRKRNILIREMMGLIESADAIQAEIDSTFRDAYEALKIANITQGLVDEIADATPTDDSISIRYRSIMGVEIPTIPASPSPLRVPYGFFDTDSALDDAFIKFQRVKTLCRRLAEVETTIYRLADAVKKTQKRANALKNIIIPTFEADVKFITGALEEKEREEFGRLKVIKRNKQK